jgi:coproporphyrinogen III oxidase
MVNKEMIAERFREIQASIVDALELTDGRGKFRSDNWERPGGGGGLTRVLENGNIIEKGGVNFSAVYGALPANISKALQVETEGFYATGVSIVLHPHNPHVPIIHMNIRYFELDNGNYWFGGGIDLTPHYIVDEDARFFHHALKSVCDRHHPSFYESFRQWADDYFFIKHRDETRGIGGVFFDRLDEKTHGLSKSELFAFVYEIGEAFAPIYTSLMKKNAGKTFDTSERHWQLLRRGRYVEFNLVYDKGTRFGLDTGGRIESILMSLPTMAAWEYDVKPLPDSPEDYTLKNLVKGKNWID